jgi:hypothetical protein
MWEAESQIVFKDVYRFCCRGLILYTASIRRDVSISGRVFPLEIRMYLKLFAFLLPSVLHLTNGFGSLSAATYPHRWN